MNYEVLARKWRPLTFDEVVGQNHITRTLKKAVETGRLAHAYMFAGPRGCGKTSTARILARVINCENLPGDGNPCNQCESCRAVIAGSNLDVLEIDGASHTGVNEVRDLQESIGYVPSQFRNKVYIIDEVHMLSTHAFNALLKTLEEPPRHVYFIFATTAPQKIPDTIKSRCQRHSFKRLEINEIVSKLRAICEAEGAVFEDEGLRLLARKADGSMRDGTSLLDQCITSSDANVTTVSVREILGLIEQEKVFAFMESLAGGDPTPALGLLSTCIDEGVDVQELCVALLEGYRDLMLLAAPGDLSDLLFASKDEVEPLRGLITHYELTDLVTIVERLCNTTPRLKTAADPRILLESLLVDLALLDRQVDIRKLIADLGTPDAGSHPRRSGKVTTRKNIDSASNAPQGQTTRKNIDSASNAPTVTPMAQTTRKNIDSASDASQAKQGSAGSGTAAGSVHVVPAQNGHTMPVAAEGEAEAPVTVSTGGGEVNPETLGELWDGFVAYVRGKKLRLGVSLISGKVHSIDEKILTLRFAKSFNGHKEYVEKPENTKLIKEYMIQYFGRDIDFVFFVDGQERRIERDRMTRQTKVKTDNLRGVPEEKKPLVKKLLKEFDGEIIRYNP